MAGDIFISYRRSGQAKPELVHRLLNEHGVGTLLRARDERESPVGIAAREIA